ncbi:MAG: universal stress protein [Polyangiaceae bacterium]
MAITGASRTSGHCGTNRAYCRARTRQISSLKTKSSRNDAQLTLTHAWELPNLGYGSELYLPSDLLSPFEQAAQVRLEDALLAVKSRWARATSVLRTGAPWQQFLKAAELVGADLIVVGTHGRRGLQHALLGTVAERVVRMAEIPVLTAHGA